MDIRNALESCLFWQHTKEDGENLQNMKFTIKFGRVILQIIYQFMKVFPVENKVTMISRQSNKVPLDFQLLSDSLKQKVPDIKITLLCHTLDGGANASIKNKIRYCFHMFEQMYHIATSKLVLLDTYCITASLLKHRKRLKIIQIWHSMGTMKLFGYTALGNEEGSSRKIAECMRMHANYDFFIAASENYRNHLAAGFNCDKNKAFICPLPRYDLLKNNEYKVNKQKEIYSKYPELRGRKKILYCPTFRKDEEEMKQALHNLIKYLPEGFELIVKLHPLSRISVTDKHVWILKEFSTFDTLFIADYVISDYSCVVYEAGILKLPLCFYIFDFEQYGVKRGLAIDFEKEVKGVISPKASVIMEAIKNGKFDMQKIQEFITKYITDTDCATDKLSDFLIKVGELKK